MSLYTMVGSGNATLEAAALRVRLASWHDAMVAHERKIRAGRTENTCDEECPHAEARTLWAEAQDVFGDHARELAFLRSRAAVASEPSEELIAPADFISEAADGRRRPTGSDQKAAGRRSQPYAHSSERSRTATVRR